MFLIYNYYNLSFNFSKLEIKLENPVKIGEGWRGEVYCGFLEGKKVAIKVAKRKEAEEAIRKEARILEFLKGLEGVPKLVYKGKDFFIYEFVEGMPFGKVDWTREELKKIFLKLVDICYKLDKMGVSQGEMHNIEKNVVVNKKDMGIEVHILDFDRGCFSKKPRNIPQLLQVLRRYSFISTGEAIEKGKSYIKNPEKVISDLKYLIEHDKKL